MGVNVHAVNVVEQDALAFGNGKFPAASGSLHQHRLAAFRPFGGIVLCIEIPMPFKQVFISAEQE